MEQKLLPCPFCGLMPEFWQNKAYEAWHLGCPNEDCPMESVGTIPCATRKKAIELWNTRPTAPKGGEAASQEPNDLRWQNGKPVKVYPAEPPKGGETSEGEAVGSIIRKWLEANGYDGLCQEECECGCKLDDLAPCESSDFINCIPGHITPGKDGYDFFIKPGKATRPKAPKGLRRVDVVRIIDDLLYNLNNHLHDPQMSQRDIINAIDRLATEPEAPKEGERNYDV